MKINIERATLSFLALVMLASFVAFPASVSAAPKEKNKATGNIEKKTKIPTSFSSREACLVELKKHSVSTIKSYGDRRIDKRLKSVEKYPASIEKTYAPYEKAEKVTIGKIEKANRLEIASTGGVSPPNVPINSHKDSLLREVSKTKELLNSKKVALGKANTSDSASEIVCSVFYDLRVYSYLDNKIKAQKNVDIAKLQIAKNNARQKAVKKIYEKYKDNKSFAKKSSKLKAKIEGLPDSSAYQKDIDGINSLQGRLDAINVEALNTNNESTKAEIAAIIAESKTSYTNAKTQGKNIDNLYASIKKVIAKPTAPKKTVREDDLKGTIEGKYEAPGVLK